MTKKFKFNIVDLIIIAIIVFAVAFFCVKFIGERNSDSYAAPTAKVRVTFYAEECPDYVPANTKIGDSLYDQTDTLELGTIVDITVGDAVIYVETDSGEIVKASKEGYNSITITSEMSNAVLVEYGIQAGTSIIAPGHSVTVYAGGGKYFGKISGIEVIE